MIYLDNAATSYPKPPQVLTAMGHYLGSGGNPGRSGHRLARDSEELIWNARRLLADMLCVDQPERVVFTHNATAALNMAIKGLLRPRERCLISSFEHNSVVRPLHALRELGVVTTAIPPAPDSPVDLDWLEAELRTGTVRLVVLCHASNVTGVVMPLGPIHTLTASHGVPLVLDAAQTMGHVPVTGDMAEVVVFSGHKGLFGPQGTGGMYVSDGVRIRPLLHGGTGGRSEVPHQPRWLPFALESGTPNGVGIAGLAAAVRYVVDQGVDVIAARERALRLSFVDALRDVPGVRVHEWVSSETPVPVVSATFDNVVASSAATMLEDRYDVLVRAGLHCAPLAHRTLDTAEHGTVRFALSHLTAETDLSTTVSAVADIARLSEAR